MACTPGRLGRSNRTCAPISIRLSSDRNHLYPAVAFARQHRLAGQTRESSAAYRAADVFEAIVFGWRFPRTLLAQRSTRPLRRGTQSNARACPHSCAYTLNSQISGGPCVIGQRKQRSGLSAGTPAGHTPNAYEFLTRTTPNKTIVDRYYGAASTRRRCRLPRLITLAATPSGQVEGSRESPSTRSCWERSWMESPLRSAPRLPSKNRGRVRESVIPPASRTARKAEAKELPGERHWRTEKKNEF